MLTHHRVHDLVAHVQRGEIFEALKAFYADDVVMQENLQPPTVGKHANLERERAFHATVARLDRSEAKLVLVDGDHAVIHWTIDYLGTDGKYYHFDQIALQTWRGEGDEAQIVHERFVYDPATLVVPEPAPVGRAA